MHSIEYTTNIAESIMTCVANGNI